MTFLIALVYYRKEKKRFMSSYELLKKDWRYFLIPVILIAICGNFVSSQDSQYAVGNPQSESLIRPIESLDEHPEYETLIRPINGKLRVGEESTLEISIRYGSQYGHGKKPGDPVGNLQVVYDRILEVFIVSEDMMHLFHTRPEEFGEITPEIKASGRFNIRHAFPWGGRYRVVANFSHNGQMIYKHFDIYVEGPRFEGSGIKAEGEVVGSGGKNPQSGVFDGYNVTCDVLPFPPDARRKAKLTYFIRNEKGEELNGLEVFMGTEMHFVCWREDIQYFGYERTKLEEGVPGSILIVPPVKTDMLYGTGVLREIGKDGKMIIEHGPIEGLLPGGKFPFKVKDKEAELKVEVGDNVEFWIVNRPETGLAITRIEPLAGLPSDRGSGVFQYAGNLPIYPGPEVVIEHVFPASGRYIAFGQFMYQNKIVTTRFVIDVAWPASLPVNGKESMSGDKDEGIVRLTPQEQNGQMIYLTSKSPSEGTIYIKQEDGTKLDAVTSGITCVGCHGEDGRGGQEAGAITSDIRYIYLTKPYGVTHPSGRKHPPYTDELLRRSITEGIDPAGNRLDPTMVRWDMSEKDLDGLVAYIHRLSEMARPGVTDELIKIGCVLDISGPLADAGRAVKEMIEAAFKVINTDRNIYGRSLKLVVSDGGNDTSKSLEAARRLVEEENVFCMIGNLGEAATREVIPYLEKKGVPLIAPLSPTYQGESTLLQDVFYMFPSPAFQARVMVDFIMQSAKKDEPPGPGIAVIYSNDRFGKAGLEAAKDQLANYRQRLVAEIDYDFSSLDPVEIAKTLSEKKADNVLVLTPDPRIAMIVMEADKLSYSPKYLCNNMLIMPSIFKIPRASERFLMIQNFSFAGRENPATAEFMEIIKGVQISQHHLIMQAGAFAGVKVLEEGLRLTGRDLTRRSFINGMERLRVDTGLFGVISYGRGERDGVSGVFMVRPDETTGNFIPVTKWLRPMQKGGLY